MKISSAKLGIVLGAALVVFGAEAASLPRHRLVQIENDDFEYHSLRKALRKLHFADVRKREPYRCDGKQEFELLPELIHPNPKSDSLRIQSWKGKELGVYRSGTLYSADGVSDAGPSLREDPFVKIVLGTLSTLETLPSGAILLDRLEHSPYPLTIRYTAPHFWAEDSSGKPLKGMMMAQAIQLLNTQSWPNYGDEFDHVGAGGEIGYDPKLSSLFVEDDGVKRPAATHVVLAHEMMHAFDGIRGLLDRREVVGKKFEFIEVTEYRATYLENRIRKESGLHYRKYYSEGDGPGSLLGDDGNPMLFPAPCLKRAFHYSRSDD